MSHQGMHGEPCWIELFTHDVDTAVSFYEGLFGWSAGEPSEEFGGYRMFMRGDQPIAGLMPNTTAAPNAWTVYLASDDAAATAAAAEKHGGQVLQVPAPVADLGIFGGVLDPAGAYVGIWQSLSFPGFITRNEVGAPDWFETLSRDYNAAVAFYRDVFGWQTSVMSESPEFRYTTLGEGRDARAGIMDAAGFLGDEPSRWQFYLRVADADASVGLAVATGAQVVTPITDSPYGRMATLTDPAGVRFCVMAPNPA
jgi:uncharacterized protein